jgi:hypothetical protein
MKERRIDAAALARTPYTELLGMRPANDRQGPVQTPRIGAAPDFHRSASGQGMAVGEEHSGLHGSTPYTIRRIK